MFKRNTSDHCAHRAILFSVRIDEWNNLHHDRGGILIPEKGRPSYRMTFLSFRQEAVASVSATIVYCASIPYGKYGNYLYPNNSCSNHFPYEPGSASAQPPSVGTTLLGAPRNRSLHRASDR